MTDPQGEKQVFIYSWAFYALWCVIFFGKAAHQISDYLREGEGVFLAVCVGYLMLGSVVARFWYSRSGRVIVDQDSVALERWRKTTRIRFADVTRLEHRVESRCLILYAGEKCIRVGNQLRDFPKFHGIIANRVPPLAKEPIPQLPLEVARNKFFDRLIWSGICFLVGAVVLIFWLYQTVNVTVVIVIIALFASLAIVPEKYVFSEDKLMILCLLSQKEYPFKLLQEVKLERVSKGLLEASIIRLKFIEKGEVVLREQLVGYSLELLYEALKEWYQK